MKLQDTKIKFRLLTVLAMALISFLILIGVLLSNFKTSLLDAKALKTRHVVESVFNVFEHYHRLETSGQLSREEAQQQAISVIKVLRYESNDYFWINDLSPTMIMHPIKPSLDGKDLSGFADPDGKQLFVEMANVVRRDGAGYVPYLWPKPGFDDPVEKISYVKGFTPWNWIIGSGIYLDDVAEEFFATSTAIIITAIVLFLVMTIMIITISKSITLPLSQTLDALHDISKGDGDLTQRLKVRGKDELGELAQSFNVFVEKIADLVRNVNQNVNAAVATSGELVNINDGAKNIIDEQNDQTTRVAQAIDEMTVTIQDIARNTEAAAQEASEGQEAILTGQRVFVSTADEIKSLAVNINSAADVIQNLAKETESIGGVLDVIGTIAEQTNLLALNAAIEAARAGEQGRGFAVVADEVRTLANRTQQSTAEIQNMIHRLQSGASSAVNVISSSVSMSEHSASEVNEANEALNKIISSIANLNDMNTLIASAAEQQSVTVIEISRSVNEISSLSETSTQKMQESVTFAESIAGSSKKLDEQIKQFKV